MPQADDRTVNNIAESIAASGRWKIVQNEYAGHALLERPRDGLRVAVGHVYKQKTLEVHLGVNHLKIYRERQTAVANRHSTRARATMSDVISAIERVVRSGEQEYRELVAEVEEAARERLEMLVSFDNVAFAFGTKINGRPQHMSEKDRENWKPSLLIDSPGLHLSLEANCNKSVRVTGYSNTINTDLLLRLIPVIKQWQKEQQEMAA
jgi:hypothetical protein